MIQWDEKTNAGNEAKRRETKMMSMAQKCRRHLLERAKIREVVSSRILRLPTPITLRPGRSSSWSMMIMIRRTMLMLTKGKHNKMTEVFLLILMMVMRRRKMRRRMTYAFLPQ